MTMTRLRARAGLFLLAPLLALLLLQGAAAPQYYTITRHHILIEVDEQGNGKITETHFLSFAQPYLLGFFKEQTEKLGADPAAWERFDPRFRIRIWGLEKLLPQAGSGQIGFSVDSPTTGQVQIRYVLAESVMERVEDRTRWSEFRLRKTLFNEFLVSSGTYSLPANTVVEVALPRRTSVLEVDAAARVEERNPPTVAWEGPLVSNELKLRYRVFKDIAPPFSIAYFARDFFERTKPSTRYVLAALALAVAAVLYLLRRPLRERITAFVEKHSVLTEP